MAKIEIVKGGQKNRGNIIQLPPGQTNTLLDYYGKENVYDCHNSTYLLGDSYSVVRGYDDICFCEYLLFDFDSHESIDDCRKDVIELLYRLDVFSNSEERTRIFFSGNKGFHVVFRAPELDVLGWHKSFNKVHRDICFTEAEGLKTWDHQVYNKTGLIRTANSTHPKTSLFKVPITSEQLESLTNEELFEYAKTQHKVEPFCDVERDDNLIDLIKSPKEFKNVSDTKTTGDATNNFVLGGIQSGFNSGNRDNGLTSLCGMLHRRCVDRSFIEAILDAVNDRSNAPLPQHDLTKIIESVGQYSQDDNFKDPDKADFTTFRQAGKKWLDNVQNSGKFNLGERYEKLNEVLSSSLKGDLIGIVGASGSGKSTLSLDFCNEYSKFKGCFSVFFSLEMAAHACFFRGATMKFEPNDEGEIHSNYVTEQMIENREIIDKISDEWKNILILDKGSIPLERIKEYAGIANDMVGGNLGSISIDYAQYIEGATNIDKAALIARHTKDVVKALNVYGFIAIQTNKTMPNAFTEIFDNHIEGVGAIKQACDYMIAFWKSRDTNKRLHGKFLKSRWSVGEERLDLVRNGLIYRTEDVVPDRNMGVETF